MRLSKMLGLAVITAMAAMAFIGASSASAVTLCKVNQSPCEAANQYLSGTEIKAELLAGTVAELKTDLATVQCTTSTSAGKTTATSGSPLPGSITNLTFTNCKTTGLVGCTVTVLRLPYKAAVTAEGAGNGFLAATSGGSGNPGATVVCGVVLNCTFSTPEAKLLIDGGEPSELLAKEVELERSGSICPEESFWTASYKVTSPTKGWVAASP